MILSKLGSVLHLKYLSLRGCNISCLPNSLGNLTQLETLDIRGTLIYKLPKAIFNLRKLNHLRASFFYHDEDMSEDLLKLIRMWYCLRDWTAELMKISSLIFSYYSEAEWNIRNICSLDGLCDALSNIEMPHCVIAPRGLRRLTALRTLTNVNIGWRTTAVLEDLKRLTQLRRLAVSGIDKKNSQKLCSALAALGSLESLSLTVSLSVQVAGSLGEPLFDRDDEFSPPKNLKSLKLNGDLVELPKWIQQLKNLVKLKLYNSRIKDYNAAIQVLGELPNLAILVLWYGAFEVEGNGELHLQEGTFGRLVVLDIYFGVINKCIKFQQGALRKLELLLLNGNMATKFSGLEFLPNIKEVQIDVYTLDEQQEEAAKGLLMDLLVQLSKNPNNPFLKLM